MRVRVLHPPNMFKQNVCQKKLREQKHDAMVFAISFRHLAAAVGSHTIIDFAVTSKTRVSGGRECSLAMAH